MPREDHCPNGNGDGGRYRQPDRLGRNGLVEGKQWITAKDDKVSDVCNANGGMGVIGLHEPFSHGALTIPEHPNGRCAVVPVVGRTGKLAKGSRAMETGDGRQARLFPYRAANWGIC